ncbi:MAG: hypothetical protein ACFB10_15360 [Salibacteraceae bacterium]
MRPFVIKVFGFLFLLAVIAGALSLLPHQSSPNDYMAGIVQKHARLDSIPGPRLLLAAGSNMAFGVNSPRLEKELDLPVVNLALHAGLGYQFIINELEQSMDSGDIALLSLEYFLNDGDPRLRQRTEEHFPPAANYHELSLFQAGRLRLENTRTQLRQWLQGAVKKSRPPRQNPIYHQSAFNAQGDIVSFLGKENPTLLKGRETVFFRNWEAIEAMNRLAATAQKKQVKVFFLYPAFAESEYAKNKKVIAQLDGVLKTDLQLEIINRPEDFVYPDQLFFDTVYHLNEQGRERRTSDLLRILRNQTASRKALEQAVAR